MPWRETSPMDQKTQFIADYLRDSLSITGLCALYGISRKSGYKWMDLYIRNGPAGRSVPVIRAARRIKPLSTSWPRFFRRAARRHTVSSNSLQFRKTDIEATGRSNACIGVYVPVA